MKKKIKSLFCSLSVASVLLLGCAGIPNNSNYSCSATYDSSDVYYSSMQEESQEENQEYTSAETSKTESSSQEAEEEKEQSDSVEPTEESTVTESAGSTELSETTVSTKDFTEEKKDNDSEKKGSFLEGLRNNIISILLFVVGLVCGFTIAYAFNFISNEKTEKKQLKELESLSMEIENAKIKIKDLNATNNELKELLHRIEKIDETLKNSEETYK